MDRKIEIALLIKDREYLNAISNSILRNSKDFLINSFYCRDLRGIDNDVFNDNAVVLTDLPYKEFDNLIPEHREKIIFLLERLRKSERENEDSECDISGLYKYTDSNAIISRIFSKYRMLNGPTFSREKSAGQKRCKFLLVKSISGNSGNSSIALAIGDELMRFHGKKVLLIGFDEFCIFNGFAIKTQNAKSIRKLIYLLSRYGAEHVDIGEFLNYDKFGVAFFNDSQEINYLSVIKLDELCRLCEAIELSSAMKFDFIVADFNGLWGSAVFEYLTERADLILLTMRSDEGISKYNRRYDFITKTVGFDEDKIFNVENFADIAAQYPIDERHMLLPADYNFQSADESGCKMLILDREFGQGIQQITKVILKKMEMRSLSSGNSHDE